MTTENSEQLMCVLVADDDRVICRVVRRILENAGFFVKTADDGLIALDLLRTSGPWLAVVTDREMPRLGGCTLAVRAHQLHPALPVLMMASQPTRLTNGAAAEIDGYIPKPFGSPEQLLKALQTACETRAGRVQRTELGLALRKIETEANGRKKVPGPGAPQP